MVDARKFSSGKYLKAADDGAVIKRIINAAQNDRYGRLDVWFEDGTRLSLSGRNNDELIRAYSWQTDLWLDKRVQLTVEDYVNNDGKPGKMIVLAAADPEVPREERPKPTTSVLQEKPPPKTGNGSPRPDMDDEIPF